MGYIVFDEYERDSWATGGTLHSIKFGEGFAGRWGLNDYPPSSCSINKATKFTKIALF
jgi:hypothetical protein